MADQPQTPHVGVVGQQPGQQQSPQQQAPIPGVQQPPVPSAEMIAKVKAEQQRQTQQQIAEAQARAGYTPGQQQNASAVADANNRFTQSSVSPPAQQTAAPAAQPAAPAQPAPVAAPAPNPAMNQIPAAIAATMPPGMRPPQAQQPAPPPAPSPVPGMSPEQVLAGPVQQQNFTPVYANQQQPAYQTPPQNYPQQPAPAQGNRIAALAGQEKEAEKPVIPWFPIRGPKDSLDIHLTDCIIKAVPAKGPPGESNAGAKVVLALFSEILALREEVAALKQIAGQGQVPNELYQRVYTLEATLFEQRQAMSQKARGVREQIFMLQQKGHSPDQILAQLSGQQEAAAQMVATGSMPAAQHTAVAQPPAAAEPAPQPAPEPAATDAQNEESVGE